MGEQQSTLFSPDFNRSIQVEAREERLTSDAGALLLREVFSRLGLEAFFAESLVDPRRPDLITHPQIELLRSHVLLLAQGWRDQDDADFHRQDPVLRLSVSQRRGTGPLESPPEGAQVADGLASQPTLSRLVKALSPQAQRSVLRESLLTAVSRRVRAMRGHRMRYVTLDVDSLPIEVHGQQEILESRVVSSRGRHNPRAVKRKVSKFPTRSRAKRTRPTRTYIGIEIVK